MSNNEEKIEKEALELTINKPFEKFTQGDQNRLLKIIAEALKMDEKEIKFIKKYKGSVKLQIAIPKIKGARI